MALRGRRIDDFFEIWSIVPSGQGWHKVWKSGWASNNVCTIAARQCLLFCQNWMPPLPPPPPRPASAIPDLSKRTAWSLIYFLIYIYLNILVQSQILVNSLYLFVKGASINYFWKHLVLLSAFPNGILLQLENFCDRWLWLYHTFFFSVETKIYLNFDITWNQSHYMEVAQEAIS